MGQKKGKVAESSTERCKKGAEKEDSKRDSDTKVKGRDEAQTTHQLGPLSDQTCEPNIQAPLGPVLQQNVDRMSVDKETEGDWALMSDQNIVVDLTEEGTDTLNSPHGGTPSSRPPQSEKPPDPFTPSQFVGISAVEAVHNRTEAEAKGFRQKLPSSM